MKRALLALVALGASAACSGGHDETPTGVSAWVNLVLGQNGIGGVTAEAYFYSAPHEAFPNTLVLDSCFDAAVPTATPPLLLDAGETVRLENSTDSMSLDRQSDGSYVGAGPLGGEAWDLKVVQNSDVVRQNVDQALPAIRQATPVGSSFHFIKGDPFSFEWSGNGSGAELISITWGIGASFEAIYCRAIDDGEFTMPGERTAMLNSEGSVYFVNLQHTDAAAGDLTTAGYSLYGPGPALPFTAD